MAQDKQLVGGTDGLARRLGRRTVSRMAMVGTTALVAVALSACSSSSSSTTSSTKAAAAKAPQSKQLTAVSFENDFSPTGDDSYYVYAKDKGYYAQQGIDLTIDYGTGSATTAEEVGSGKIDIGDAYSLNALAAVGDGEPIEIVGTTQAEDEFGIFTPKSSGITTLAGLAGKSLLCAPGTAEATLLPGVLKAAGISQSAVHVEGVSPAVILSEYERGAADAACFNVAGGFAKEVDAYLPSNSLLFSAVGYDTPTQVIMVNKAFMKAHPNLVRGFLVATYQGIIGSIEHPSVATADFLQAEPTLTTTSISEVLTGVFPFLCSSAMKSANDVLGYNNVADWTSALSAAKEYANVPSSLTLSDALTNQFFEGSNPVSTTTCSTVQSLIAKSGS